MSQPPGALAVHAVPAATVLPSVEQLEPSRHLGCWTRFVETHQTARSRWSMRGQTTALAFAVAVAVPARPLPRPSAACASTCGMARESSRARLSCYARESVNGTGVLPRRPVNKEITVLHLGLGHGVPRATCYSNSSDINAAVFFFPVLTPFLTSPLPYKSSPPLPLSDTSHTGELQRAPLPSADGTTSTVAGRPLRPLPSPSKLQALVSFFVAQTYCSSLVGNRVCVHLILMY